MTMYKWLTRGYRQKHQISIICWWH